MKIRIKVEGNEIIANLAENATSRDFASLLPLSVTLKDHAGTEKITYLSRKLSIEGSPPGCDPEAGDIGYYAPGATSPFITRTLVTPKGLSNLDGWILESNS